jgi:hypothetical protein
MHCSNLSLFDHPVGSARPSSEAVWQSQVPYRFQIERWKGISIDKNFKFDAAQQLPASCKLFQF